MHARALHRMLPCLAAAAMFFAARSADAKGIIIINHGDSIDHVTDLAPEARSAVQSELGVPAAIGYKYSSFGVFWLDLWTWDGSYVLFHDDTFWDVDSSMLAELAGVSSVDDLGKPWQYRFPPGLIIVSLLIFGAAGWGAIKWRRRQRLEAAFSDVRFQNALSMMAPDQGEGASFDEAVTYLESQGVPRKQAQEHLAIIIAAISEQQAHADGEQDADAA